jgi:hypothetical protein
MALQQRMELQGSLLSQDTKLFRMKCVQLMFKANISAISLESVADQLETWAGAPMGGRRALMEYGELHHIIWKQHIKNSLTKLCYPQYATMTDGTPCFAAAEGMKLRVFITYYWRKKRTVSKGFCTTRSGLQRWVTVLQNNVQPGGDGFLAPIAHSILHGLALDIERGIPLDGLEFAATRVEELMKPAHDVE